MVQRFLFSSFKEIYMGKLVNSHLIDFNAFIPSPIEGFIWITLRCPVLGICLCMWKLVAIDMGNVIGSNFTTSSCSVSWFNKQ